MKILVATGSFKDVFSPLEASEMLYDALDKEKNEVSVIPFCDGGEYTYEVLRHCFPFQDVSVEGVLNPYGVPCTAHYLIRDKEAHIVSSQILRLFPSEDERKNPLMLSDYGYGQLIADALQKGCTKLILYLGGTSTVCCGMGTIQALGAELSDENGVCLKTPCKCSDLVHLSKIKTDKSCFKELHVHVVADGNSKTDDLPGITSLKVGKHFSEQTEEIVKVSMEGVKNILRLTGISSEQDFTGAAGGLLFGLEQVFSNITYTLGGLYFNEVFQVEQKIRESDLIITGEGRYDNTADGKAPSVIARLAKKNQKPAVLVCGQVDKKKLGNYSGGIIKGEDETSLALQGITRVLTCQEFFDAMSLPDSYPERIAFFRQETPRLVRQLFQKTEL